MTSKISARDRGIIILAIATLIIILLATITIVSYSQFFPALTRVEVRLTSLSPRLFNGSYNAPVLEITNVTFTAMNPTGYRGLVLSGLASTLDISSPNGTTIPQGLLFSPIIVNSPLDPGKIITVNLPKIIATGGAASLAKQTSNLQFVFFVDFTLASFLDHAGPITTSYQCASTGKPVPCEQSEIRISPPPSPGLGSGGS